MRGKGNENHWEGFENKRAPDPNSSQCERMVAKSNGPKTVKNTGRG